ncbi:putative ribonuclease h protein [Quercus suber]|uniref:Ribonuclease h protein n=1 Tax=Quercus suber TaxID=58331 RepID=A0AAW0K1U7_QUESU
MLPWRIPNIPRVSTFLWLSCNDWLLTKNQLHKRQILMDDTCPFCLTDKETTLHILRDCPTILPALLPKRVWDMRNNSIEVWDDMLRKKYSSTASIAKSKSSDICDKGTRWLIRNDVSTLFWQDNWIGHGPLRNLIHGPSIPATSPLRLWTSETPTATGTSTLYPLCYPNMSVISSMLPSNPSPPYKTTCPHGTTLLTASLNLEFPTSLEFQPSSSSHATIGSSLKTNSANGKFLRMTLAHFALQTKKPPCTFLEIAQRYFPFGAFYITPCPLMTSSP